MAVFSVDSDRLHAAVGTAAGQLEAVRSATAALTSGLQSVQDSWSGQAATAFQQVVDQWRAMQAQIEEQAAQVGQALGAAANQYGTTETDVHRMFAS